MGEVQLLQNGHPVQDPTFIREAGGFTYFGECCIDRHVQSPYTVSCTPPCARHCLLAACIPNVNGVLLGCAMTHPLYWECMHT